MNAITDKYGRMFQTLRVSLLSRCNLGCTYCSVGDESMKQNNSGKKDAIPASTLLGMIRQMHEQLQFKTIRLTGGEPLLYAELLEMIEGIRDMGIPEIKLTTNGFLLKKLAVPM